MVPWPIALLAASYVVIAASSAPSLLSAWTTRGMTPMAVWSGLWCALSLTACVGLVLMRGWGRIAAVITSTLLTLAFLSVACLALAQPKPQAGYSLAATGLAVTQLVIIRYLTRPRVRAWFTRTVTE